MIPESVQLKVKVAVKDCIKALAPSFGIGAIRFLILAPPDVRVIDTSEEWDPDYPTDDPIEPPSYDHINRQISLYEMLSFRESLGHETSHYLHHQINPLVFDNYRTHELTEIVAYLGEMLFLGGEAEEFVDSLLTPRFVSLDRLARVSGDEIDRFPIGRDYRRIMDLYA